MLHVFTCQQPFSTISAVGRSKPAHHLPTYFTRPLHVVHLLLAMLRNSGAAVGCLKDLDNADDICLFSQEYPHISDFAPQTELKFNNIVKTKLTCISTIEMPILQIVGMSAIGHPKNSEPTVYWITLNSARSKFRGKSKKGGKPPLRVEKSKQKHSF
ncbi:unnamed protein product [Ceratitis capitata]|uniref:(Mediterranean fruit fly) hypothetical protein n=1 Tax=Ceratitis capitata TaxID=7213 RepID=A0A811V3A8_CERCA|nr:unnamed protein product [Ceratitis capitata]